MENACLICLTFLDSYANQLCELMDTVARITGLPAPYLQQKLPPRVTLYHANEPRLDNDSLHALARNAFRLLRPGLEASFGGITPHGTNDIVLPLHTPLFLANVWSQLHVHEFLTGFPEFTRENTLHTTIASHTAKVFDAVWPDLRALPFNMPSTRFANIVLYRKQQGNWEENAVFPLQ